MKNIVLPSDEKTVVDANLAEAGIARTKVQQEDLLGLWKYFQDRADMLKERQWTVGTWILTLLSGNIAFSISQETVTLTEAGVEISKPLPALILGMIGMVICGYGYYVIRNYGKHIQRNWDRADQVRLKIIDLGFYWKTGSSDQESGSQRLPPESISLIVIVVGFLIVYIAMSLVSLLAFL